MYYRYVEELARITAEIFGRLSDVPVEGCRVKPEERNLTRYTLALFIPYAHLEGKVRGNFLLGFTEEETAVLVASAIAGRMGVGALTALDQTAEDVLTEFMNQVMGRTMAGWEALGFDVTFDPPRVERQTVVRTLTGVYASNWVVIVELAVGTLSFGVSFHEINRFDPKDVDVLVVDPTGLTRGMMVNDLGQAGFRVHAVSEWPGTDPSGLAPGPDVIILHQEGMNADWTGMVGALTSSFPGARLILIGSEALPPACRPGDPGPMHLKKPLVAATLIDAVRTVLAGGVGGSAESIHCSKGDNPS